MWPETEVTKRLAIRYPIIQAGMAGGITTPELVAAVSNGGGLGTLGAGYMSPEEMRKAIREIRSRTQKPFGVNLFIPQPMEEREEVIEDMIWHLHGYRKKLKLSKGPVKLAPIQDAFMEQIEVVLSESVPVFSFTFGVLPGDLLGKMKRAGMAVIGTATTSTEAVFLEESGIDMVVAQGSEAGGHRGTFLGSYENALIGTMALVPQISRKVNIPVIAAGGIMDERGIAASFLLGASGVQMGTAFLTCEESGAHRAYKEALLHRKKEEGTAITHAFSGKAARGVRNTFLKEMENYPGKIPTYPIQNALTQDIRSAAARQERVEYMSLWAGQAYPLCRTQSATGLIKGWVQGMNHLFSGQKKP